MHFPGRRSYFKLIASHLVLFSASAYAKTLELSRVLLTWSMYDNNSQFRQDPELLKALGVGPLSLSEAQIHQVPAGEMLGSKCAVDIPATFCGRLWDSFSNLSHGGPREIIVVIDSHGLPGKVAHQYSRGYDLGELSEAIVGTVASRYPDPAERPVITLVYQACHAGSLLPEGERAIRNYPGTRLNILMASQADQPAHGNQLMMGIDKTLELLKKIDPQKEYLRSDSAGLIQHAAYLTIFGKTSIGSTTQPLIWSSYLVPQTELSAHETLTTLTHADYYQWNRLLAGLKQKPPTTIETADLIAALKSDDTRTREAAIVLLSKSGANDPMIVGAVQAAFAQLSAEAVHGAMAIIKIDPQNHKAIATLVQEASKTRLGLFEESLTSLVQARAFSALREVAEINHSSSPSSVLEAISSFSRSDLPTDFIDWIQSKTGKSPQDFLTCEKSFATVGRPLPQNAPPRIRTWWD